MCEIFRATDFHLTLGRTSDMTPPRAMFGWSGRCRAPRQVTWHRPNFSSLALVLWCRARPSPCKPGSSAAGAVATALDLAPNTLTFHFDRLRTAGLVTVRRDGRSMIYAARFETMNALLGYLTDNCCGGAPCAPAVECKPARKRAKISACKISA